MNQVSLLSALVRIVSTFWRLHQKSFGTIEALNRPWNGAFWSNEYSDC
jgi:beta-galactosidase GanA